MVKNIEIVYQR